MLDRVDKIHVAALVLTLVCIGLVLVVPGPSKVDGSTERLERAMQRRMAAQAQEAFLTRSYAPVSELRAAGEPQKALLKLRELERELPGEPHGAILRGEIQFEIGAMSEATASFVKAVQGRGDYVDERSPLSRRTVIATLVEQGLAEALARAGKDPNNRTVQKHLRGLYYLQSRLAGGCE